MITIKITNTYSKIFGLDSIPIIDQISDALSYMDESAKYTFQYKTGGWSGRIRLLTSGLRFPTGLIDVVQNILESNDLDYEVKDSRVYEASGPGSDWHGFQLRDYQQMVLDKAMDKRSGMIKVATGGGKSLILSRLTYELNLPTVVYVVSLDLMNQMKETLEKSLGEEVGIVGDGNCDIKKVTVCSVWTAGKAFAKKKEKISNENEVAQDKWDPSANQKKQIKDMVESAKVIILDEAQFAAAASIQNILKNSKSAAYRYGFSGTPWRTGGDDILLTAAFGETIVDLNASELIQKGWLVKPKIYFRDIPKYTKTLPKKWQAVNANYIVSNEVRNNIIIGNLKALLDMGRKPLILFRQIKHGNILESMLPSDVSYRKVTGKLSKDERDSIREDFKSGAVDMILASSVYDQGVDLPNLDALILAGGGKSTAKALQRIGRVIRGNPGKEDAIVVDTFDQSHYTMNHSYKRFEIYNTEPEFEINKGKRMSAYLKKYYRID